MNRKYLIPILAVLSIIVVAVELIFFAPTKKNSYSTIYLEINPSIEIKMDKEEKIISVKALNEDAKEVVNDSLEGLSFDELINKLADNLIDNGYVSDNQITMLIHVDDGETSEIENRIKNKLLEKDILTKTIVIEEVSSEDEEYAKKHNISSYKAAYLNSIKEENESINIDELVDKPIRELEETRITGNTCEEGYFLENDHCLKEIGRKEAIEGSICPNKYMDYNGKCYLETPYIERDNLVCSDSFVLTNGKCVNKSTAPAEGVCESNHYDMDKDVCHEQVYIGDAYEFCRDSGRTLYDHKCLATKPTINGGCLNGDMLYNGKCVNTRNDYYASEWRCPNGQMNSSDTGNLLFPDNKCYENKEVKPSSYKCNDDYVLDGKTCIKEEVQTPQKERVCPNGFTMVPYDRCINLNDSKEFESGKVCDQENAKVQGNVCIIYDVIDAKKISR